MIIEIPLIATANQSLQIVLNDQNCTLVLYQRGGRFFMDLVLDGLYVWRGHICHDRYPVRQFKAQEFVGNFVFIDHNGTDGPVYSGLGQRFRLYYITDDVLLPAAFQRRGTED